MYVNAKIIPVETVPGLGQGDKGEWLRRQSHVWYIWYIVQMPQCIPRQHNNKGQKISHKKESLSLRITEYHKEKWKVKRIKAETGRGKKKNPQELWDNEKYNMHNRNAKSGEII
jgi:hypothetical protein